MDLIKPSCISILYNLGLVRTNSTLNSNHQVFPTLVPNINFVSSFKDIVHQEKKSLRKVCQQGDTSVRWEVQLTARLSL